MNERQRRFCESYAKNPNATAAAIEAGYSKRTAYSIGQRLLKNVEVSKYLEELQEAVRASRIADVQEICCFWSDIMRDDTQRLEARLKASEMLAKAAGGFVQRVEAEVDATVDADVVFYIPANNRPVVDCEEM